MDVILYRGSFDPPNLGHLNVASTVANEKDGSEAWFLPTNSSPFGTRKLTPLKDRIEMIKLMLLDVGENRINVCEAESYMEKT